MRSPSRPEVWALGDCASIPAPTANHTPPWPRHALREAKVLAGNIHAVLDGRPPRPFVYRPWASWAPLGHGKGLAQVWGSAAGFPGVVVRRTYYLSRCRAGAVGCGS